VIGRLNKSARPRSSSMIFETCSNPVAGPRGGYRNPGCFLRPVHGVNDRHDRGPQVEGLTFKPDEASETSPRPSRLATSGDVARGAPVS